MAEKPRFGVAYPQALSCERVRGNTERPAGQFAGAVDSAGIFGFTYFVAAAVYSIVSCVGIQRAGTLSACFARQASSSPSGDPLRPFRRVHGCY